MDTVTRIGISIEPDLLEKFDKMIEDKGYETRSEAFRDIIKDSLTKTLLQDDDMQVCGTITLLYNHHKGDVKEKLTDIQHDNFHMISSSIHVHLDLDRCLEVLVVLGTVAQVKDLSNKLESVKGVKCGIPAMLSGEMIEEQTTKKATRTRHRRLKEN
jgi:CopG family transcriptional regulator, nickel-responsive regulator